ncbi:MAG: ATPase [Thiothrix lacustris]|uniref:ATPase n=1 Tax=Thiothrix lacustris TaxID=525917 RepID=A0A1Y1QQE2_9GAMM|nr:MAG: ATPase [Thiothrix lacustris]
MLHRHITADVQTYLAHLPSLLITGARQVGKSTLALSLGIDNYVTLDDIATYQSAKADPKGFILSLRTPVVIDEVQRVPEVFVAIKEQIDQDCTPGRFVLTGSSNLQGFKQVSDSLAGRIGIVDLYAFNLSEIIGQPVNFIDDVFAGKPFATTATVTDIAPYIIKGGFPEVQRIEHPKTRMLWFSSYIRSHVERDLLDMGNIRNLDSFMRLYLSLALRSANLLNKSDLANDCQIDAKTLDNYLSILKNTYQVALLKPWFTNAAKRLVKMPKVFMLDTGILCHLLKITSPAELHQSNNRGAVYETFVLSELVKANTYATQPVDLSFYRTSDGKEIDFVLDNGKGLVLLEVKAAHSVTPTDFRHIRHFIEQNPGRVVQGMVLYAGERALPFGECDGVGLWAVPLGMMAG